MILIATALAAAAPCTLPPGWEMVNASHARYVILGEIHGTQQAPALVSRVACALARRHERVLVAIEHQAKDNDALSIAWQQPDASFVTALRTYPGWKGRNDGVASQAMFDLLVSLHRINVRRPLIDVVAFNGERDPAQRDRFAGQPLQGPHEAAQAENIRDAAARRPYDHVLVLTGSLHARKQPVPMGAGSFEPMARQFAPPEQTLSLRFVTGSGSMWNCLLKAGVDVSVSKRVTDDMVDCGLHPTRAMASLGPSPRVVAGDPPGAEGGGNYDGYVWLGAITGSPPAMR